MDELNIFDRHECVIEVEEKKKKRKVEVTQEGRRENQGKARSGFQDISPV